MGQLLDQGCNTEPELYEMFEHVKTVCHSADEKFVDPYDPVPSSCVTLDCADAVRRAERECGPLLDKSGWFKTRKSQLAAAVHRCETAAVDPDRYVVQPPIPSGPMRGTVHTISGCRGTISDGEGKFDKCEYALLRALPGVHLDACWCARGLVASDGNNWKRFAKVDAGPGLHVKFELEMLDMGAGDVLILSDGEANTPLSECSRGMSAKCPRMISLKGQEIKPPGAYVSSGRYAYVTMLTDSSGSNLRGFRLKISCVCADSERWTATRQSSGCARFAKGAHQSLHSTCEAPPGGVAAQGVVRPWMNSGQSAHLVLPAAVACPKACGKCEVDPCQHVQCQHGGQCVNMVTGAHGACQSLEQFTSFETAVTSACCDEPGEKCAGGAPQSCNSGCAKVFLPGYRACSGGFLKKHRKGYEAIKKTMDHVQQLCHNGAGGGHRRRAQQHAQQRATCACAAGWTGAQCQSNAAPGAAGRRRAQVCSRVNHLSKGNFCVFVLFWCSDVRAMRIDSLTRAATPSPSFTRCSSTSRRCATAPMRSSSTPTTRCPAAAPPSTARTLSAVPSESAAPCWTSPAGSRRGSPSWRRRCIDARRPP
eukprot:SAG25_NODE_159_length_13431_cov_7.038629_7_plen_593_part_00